MKFNRWGDPPLEPITVEQKTVGRSHKYIVDGVNNEIDGVLMPSVTGILGRIDGTSTTPISRWAVKHAVQHWADYIDEAKSITEVRSNKDKLIKESKASPNRIFKEAGNRGTRIHEAVGRYLTVWNKLSDTHWSEPLDLDVDNYDKLEACFSKIKNWIDTVGFQIVALEMPVFSDVMRVGGTVDMLLWDGEDRVIVADFKTGSNIYFKDGLQVAAYIASVARMANLNIELWDDFHNAISVRPTDIAVGGTVIHINEQKEEVNMHHLKEFLLNAPIFHSAMTLYYAQEVNEDMKFQVQSI